jgi:DnaJ-class molecular chaperone
VADNPYEILGVKPNATAEEIRAAYRKLAKQLHPDLNPGDRQAEDKFKAVASAYDILGDPEKRSRFDRGEIDASGAERPRERYYRDFHGAGAQEHAYSSDAGYADFGDVLSDLFGRAEGGRTRFRMRGNDVHYRLEVEFLEAVNGATKRISLPDGSTLDVTIPAGTTDGQVLRLRGKGGPGIGGGPSGDALVTIEVRPHPFFTRKGDDVELVLPVTLREAVLGARLEVPTPSGRVRLTIPKGASSGTRLRLRGKGAPRRDGSRGDEYAIVSLVLPDRPDPELEAFAQRWSAGEGQNPRRHLEGAA